MNYREAWTAAWNFQKRYQEIREDDEYWQQMRNEAAEIEKQFDNSRFIHDLLLAVMIEFNRQYKEMIGIANT